MLNVDRLRVMTRLAMQEEKTGDDCAAAENIARRDYVSFHGAIAVFVGTLLYVLIYVGVVCALIFSVIYALTENTIFMLLLAFFIGYAAFLLFFILLVRRSAWHRYNAADEKLKALTELDDELLAQYGREEQEHIHDSIYEISE